LAGIVEDIADHHPRALGHQRFGMGSAHSPCSAGDQRHLVRYPRHDRLPYPRGVVDYRKAA